MSKAHLLFWILSIYMGAGMFRKKEVYRKRIIPVGDYGDIEIKRILGNGLYVIVFFLYLLGMEKKPFHFRMVNIDYGFNHRGRSYVYYF